MFPLPFLSASLVLPAPPCSFSDLLRAVPPLLLVNSFLLVFSGSTTTNIPHSSPSPPLFLVESTPLLAVVSFHVPLILLVWVSPNILTLFEIGIIKGFVYSSCCFSWFLEVARFKCGHCSYSYQNLERRPVFLLK